MDLVLKDPVFVKKEKVNLLEKFFIRFMNDERDMPFIYLSLKITCIVLPAALYLYLDRSLPVYFYGIYLVANLSLLLGPYVLMLHNTSHRRLFKKEYDYLNKYIPWILGPFYGQTPETYFHHHVGMHHAENNLQNDLSSTMKYKRDSLRHFCNYLFSFYFFGIFTLSRYFQKKRQFPFLKKTVLGEAAFFLLCIALSFYNFKGVLFIFILPFIFIRFAMMAGNWAQHAFIDPRDPGNSYKNSITCINSYYNKTCFNDGYHIGHHLRPNMHWTDMPAELLKNIEKYRKNEVIIFEGLDYFQIWFLLMCKQYKTLSKRFIYLSNPDLNMDEKITVLKSRTQTVMK